MILQDSSNGFQATQLHHSLLFAQPKNYSKDLQEDKKNKIRDCIKNYVKKKLKISYRD